MFRAYGLRKDHLGDFECCSYTYTMPCLEEHASLLDSLQLPGMCLIQGLDFNPSC